MINNEISIVGRRRVGSPRPLGRRASSHFNGQASGDRVSMFRISDVNSIGYGFSDSNVRLDPGLMMPDGYFVDETGVFDGTHRADDVINIDWIDEQQIPNQSIQDQEQIDDNIEDILDLERGIVTQKKSRDALCNDGSMMKLKDGEQIPVMIVETDGIEGEDTCCICFRSFDKSKDVCCYLDCCHWFDYLCIRQALKAKGQCPLCRKVPSSIFITEAILTGDMSIFERSASHHP